MRGSRRRLTALDWLIAALAVAAAVAGTIVADRDMRRIDPPAPVPTNRKIVKRPDWIWALYYPYKRFRHDGFYALGALTLGAAAILALDRETWLRRGRLRPGVAAVAWVTLLGASQGPALLLPSASAAAVPSLWYRAINYLEFPAAGGVLGAWSVLAISGRWRPCRDPRDLLGRIVGWGWIGSILSVIGYALLFG